MITGIPQLVVAALAGTAAIAVQLPGLDPSATLATAPSSAQAAPRAGRRTRPRPTEPPLSEAARARQSLLAMADELVREVAALRGLPPRQPVARGILGRDAIRKRVRELIYKDYTSEELRLQGLTLQRLGVLPRGADLERFLLDLLAEQVAGFYDQFEHRLEIADWLAPELQRIALVHEITHALQDQHFDLRKLIARRTQDDDRQLAAAAVAEGDATSVMMEYALGAIRSSGQAGGLDLAALAAAGPPSPRFESAPAFVRKLLLFPYLSGLVFVGDARRRGSWRNVDAALRKPPASTEQVLHPEKYYASEPPLTVRCAPLASLPAGWRILEQGVMGELQLKLFLEEIVPAADAARAAAGWGGDQLLVVGPTQAEAVALLLVSALDSEADALELEQALQWGLPRLADRLAGVGDAYHAKRRGSLVVAALGVPPAALATVTAELLRSCRPAPPPSR